MCNRWNTLHSDCRQSRITFWNWLLVVQPWAPAALCGLAGVSQRHQHREPRQGAIQEAENSQAFREVPAEEHQFV